MSAATAATAEVDGPTSSDLPISGGSGSGIGLRPWVERYRPKTLGDVSHQSEVVSTLQNAVKTGRLPHLLFYGPPGSGKTSVALALCRQLWSPTEWRRRVLELNASDERGISVVRDKIKHFASLSVAGSGSSHHNNNSKTNNNNNKKKKSNFFFGTTTSTTTTTTAATPEDEEKDSTHNNKMMIQEDEEKEKEQDEEDYYPNPPYKIIILDEADTVTPDAQAALRRIIEAYSKITRFILICNYVTRIIEPLASRCAKFRFQALPPSTMKDRLLYICQDQNCDTSQIDAILDVAQGDMRRAVTTLQSAHSLSLGTTNKSSGGGGVTMTKDMICEMAGLPKESAVDMVWESLQQGSFDAMKLAVDHVLAEGYSTHLLFLAFLPRIISSSSTDNSSSTATAAVVLLMEEDKAELCTKLAICEHAILQGADESLQLLAWASTAVRCFARSKRRTTT